MTQLDLMSYTPIVERDLKPAKRPSIEERFAAWSQANRHVLAEMRHASQSAFELMNPSPRSSHARARRSISASTCRFACDHAANRSSMLGFFAGLRSRSTMGV